MNITKWASLNSENSVNHEKYKLIWLPEVYYLSGNKYITSDSKTNCISIITSGKDRHLPHWIDTIWFPDMVAGMSFCHCLNGNVVTMLLLDFILIHWIQRNQWISFRENSIDETFNSTFRLNHFPKYSPFLILKVHRFVYPLYHSISFATTKLLETMTWWYDKSFNDKEFLQSNRDPIHNSNRSFSKDGEIWDMIRPGFKKYLFIFLPWRTT